MKSKFGGNARVKRSLLNTLRRDFEILEMKKGDTIIEYFAKVMAVINQMRSNGEVMPDSKVVEKILRTLTDRFTYVVVSIEESNDTDSMTIDELQSSLVVHEQKFKRIDREEDQVLKAATEDEGYGYRGRGRGSAARGRGRGRGRHAFNKAVVEYYKCHQLRHFQYECPRWDNKAQYAEIDEEELVLMAHVEMREAKEDVWFLDSGCSNYMCGDKKWFSHIDESFKQTVKLGNDTRIVVTGKGNVKLKVGGLVQVITDVYYIPELKNNLLSIGQLQEKGIAILIRDGECRLYHQRQGLIMKTAMTANRMFILSASALTKTNSVSLAPTCFQTADICGPVSPASNSGKRFKQRVEKESGESIICLRIDRGWEFTSLEFNSFYVANGIRRQLTAAYTPQQNGTAER
eukprot:XP_025014075.1 uncharacterized protein LOC112535637 [Ricinus communis]